MRTSAGLGAVAVIGLAAALAGVDARATYGARVTADEPQYLLSTMSIVEDGDLDISDELASERWRTFHEADLPTQTAVLPDGRRVSPHDPLLPLILAPAVGIAGMATADVSGAGGAGIWLGAKATLSILSAVLAALTWWTAVRRFGVDEVPATVAVGVFAASMPWAPYGSQIYPELPAALAVMGIVNVLGGMDSGDAASATQLRGRRRVAGTCALLVALPWLAVKYAPVAASLGLVAVVSWWRQGRRTAVVAAVITAIAAGLVWIAVHLHVWTGLTAYASAELFADRGDMSAIGFAPNFVGRSRRLIGLLVGRDFGLAAWQPAWLLLVPAVAAMVARRPRRWALLVVPLAVGWLVATFVALTMQGWWSPGRQLVVVLPLAVIVIAWWAGQRRWRCWVLSMAGVVGVAAWLRLAWEASTGRVTLVVDFADTADPVLGLWRTALPAYLGMDAHQWWLHGVWVAIAVATAAAAFARARRDAGGVTTATGPVGRTDLRRPAGGRR